MMDEEKVKIVLEFRNCADGLGIKIVSVKPREISEEFKDKIWNNHGIGVGCI